MKRCSKCIELKDEGEFGKCTKSRDGLKCACKECRNTSSRETYNIDIAKSREYNHKKRIRLWAENPKYRQGMLAAIKKWHQENKEQRNKLNQKWRQNNREAYLKSKRKSTLKNRATIEGKLNHNIGTAIWAALIGRKKSCRWQKCVGYTLENLKQHLENNMPKGRTWQDYIKGELHLHHIIPREFFRFDSIDDVEFKMCWRLENLVLLDAKENVSRKNKYVA